MPRNCVYLSVPGLNGARGAKTIKSGLAKLPGVIGVSVSVDDNRVAVDYDPTGSGTGNICRKLSDMGFDADIVSWAGGEASQN